MKLQNKKNTDERRKSLASYLNTPLHAIGETIFAEKDYLGHCENSIGAVQIPLGVAGPLKISNSEFQIPKVYIPLATTEGALVASVNRGCKAITLSGGADVEVSLAGISRGPVFHVPDVASGRILAVWLKEKKAIFDRIARTTSSHLKLIGITTCLVGRNVFVRFSFDSQDAMGMNMVTIAVQKIINYIEKEKGYPCISLAGNFDIDKKPAWLNSIFGRGRIVWAEARVKKDIVSRVLKTDSQAISEVVYRKSMIGSMVSGSIGFNAHFSNIVASIFAATGQDLAHVVEGSLGVTTAEVEENGGLYFSVYLPSVVAGTVGGGTELPTQKEALSILGVAGGNRGENAKRFAAILGVAVLAGELSLTASLAEGSLAQTHQSFRKQKYRNQNSKPSSKL